MHILTHTMTQSDATEACKYSRPRVPDSPCDPRCSGVYVQCLFLPRSGLPSLHFSPMCPMVHPLPISLKTLPAAPQRNLGDGEALCISRDLSTFFLPPRSARVCFFGQSPSRNLKSWDKNGPHLLIFIFPFSLAYVCDIRKSMHCGTDANHILMLFTEVFTPSFLLPRSLPVST